MKISNVKSVELDRSTPFNHKIIFRDRAGYPLEEIQVKESNGWEQFEIVISAWTDHPDFNPKIKGN